MSVVAICLCLSTVSLICEQNFNSMGRNYMQAKVQRQHNKTSMRRRWSIPNMEIDGWGSYRVVLCVWLRMSFYSMFPVVLQQGNLGLRLYQRLSMSRYDNNHCQCPATSYTCSLTRVMVCVPILILLPFFRSTVSSVSEETAFSFSWVMILCKCIHVNCVAIG